MKGYSEQAGPLSRQAATDPIRMIDFAKLPQRRSLLQEGQGLKEHSRSDWLSTGHQGRRQDPVPTMVMRVVPACFCRHPADHGVLWYQSTSNRPAAPMPPPMHMVTTTYFSPRRLPSSRA